MTKWVFVMFYIFFLSFTLFMITLPSSPLVDVVTLSTNNTVTPPVCNIGVFAIIDVIVCAINYVAYFFQFMLITVAEGYAWLWTLVFAPLIIIMAWVIAEFIRGSS